MRQFSRLTQTPIGRSSPSGGGGRGGEGGSGAKRKRRKLSETDSGDGGGGGWRTSDSDWEGTDSEVRVSQPEAGS